MLQSVKRFPVIGPGDVIRKKNRKCRKSHRKELRFFFWASGLQQMMMKECWMVPELEKQLVEVAEMESLELEVGGTLVVAWELLQ